MTINPTITTPTITTLRLALLLDDCCDSGGWNGGDVCDAVYELAKDAMNSCPQCGAQMAVTATVCPMCGHHSEAAPQVPLPPLSNGADGDALLRDQLDDARQQVWRLEAARATDAGVIKSLGMQLTASRDKKREILDIVHKLIEDNELYDDDAVTKLVKEYGMEPFVDEVPVTVHIKASFTIRCDRSYDAGELVKHLERGLDAESFDEVRRALEARDGVEEVTLEGMSYTHDA